MKIVEHYKQLNGKEKNTLIISSISAIILVFIFLLLYSCTGVKTIKFEIARVLIQFLVVVGIGSWISHQFQSYTRKKERRFEVNETRKEILRKLIQAYSDVKQIRRTLKFKRLSQNKISYEIFDEQLKRLSEAQLLIENLNQEIENSSKYFDELNNIMINIKKMERYLGNTVIHESYSLLENQDNDPEYVTVSNHEGLRNFMDRRRVSFDPSFAQPYREAAQIIQMKILNEMKNENY